MGGCYKVTRQGACLQGRVNWNFLFCSLLNTIYFSSLLILQEAIPVVGIGRIRNLAIKKKRNLAINRK